eukprot:m51a1_g1895 hypothetical protein (119) ;mRNA; r:756028-756384
MRAGVRKVGVKPKTLHWIPKAEGEGEERPSRHRAAEGELDLGRPPQCVDYKRGDMLADLLAFAAAHLRAGGRLVFWVPAATEDRDRQAPEHEQLRLVAESWQQLTPRWGRKLVTMERT